MFTLRFPFRLAPGQAIEVDDRSFEISGRQIRFEKRKDWYTIQAEGFQSEDEARGYVPHVWAALTWVQLNARLAPEASLETGTVSYSEDPVATAANLSRSFGVKINPPVDGLADGSSPIVYPTGKTIKVITGGDAGVTVTTALDNVVRLFRDFTEFTQQARELSDKKLRVALELYAAHFSEVSVNSKFLTLVMCLEAIATGSKRPKPVLDLLLKWEEDAAKLKSSLTGDEESLAALESVMRELVFRRESSIRSQIRELVRKTLADAGDLDAEQAARTALQVYDHRSTLVHEGSLETQTLSEAFTSATNIVERVLRARFRAVSLLTSA